MADSTAQSAEPHKPYANTDWEHYMRFRPAYPSSLVNQVLAHHRVSSTSFKLAHDVGGGSGVFARCLLPHFGHVHLSDPDPANIAQARAFLGSMGNERQQERQMSTLTFSVGTGEQSDECVAPASLDLISMAASAHWTDIDATIRAVGRALAPGGTLAVIVYGPGSLVDQDISAPLHQLWESVILDMKNSMWKNSTDPIAIRGCRQNSLGNDFVPLPEDLFEVKATKRILLNVNGQGTSRFNFAEGIEPASFLDSLSRVRADEALYEYNYPEPEALGWRTQIGAGWLEGFCRTIPPAYLRYELFEERIAELDRLINERPEQKVTMEWPAALLLATRK